LQEKEVVPRALLVVLLIQAVLLQQITLAVVEVVEMEKLLLLDMEEMEAQV
jgi:hypothetical protein